MLFANVCAWFISSCDANTVFGIFCFFFWFLLGVLCIWEVLVLLVSLLCTRLGLLRCASCWTRPLGGGRCVHYLCNLLGEYLGIHKIAFQHLGIYEGFMIWEPYMPALVGRPSLHGYDACMVHWTKRALRRNCRQKQSKTSFSPFFFFLFFCLVRILGNGIGVQYFGIFG